MSLSAWDLPYTLGSQTLHPLKRHLMSTFTGGTMGSLNKTQLIGNLGADPEIKSLPDGTAVCNLSIATTEKWRDKTSNHTKEHTEWHKVVLYRRLAEIAGQYLSKGSQIYIEGKLRSRKWQDNNGVDRYTTEIEASEMQMLSSSRKQESTFSDRPSPPSKAVDLASAYDDIPF